MPNGAGRCFRAPARFFYGVFANRFRPKKQSDYRLTMPIDATECPLLLRPALRPLRPKRHPSRSCEGGIRPLGTSLVVRGSAASPWPRQDRKAESENTGPRALVSSARPVLAASEGRFPTVRPALGTNDVGRENRHIRDRPALPRRRRSRRFPGRSGSFPPRGGPVPTFRPKPGCSTVGRSNSRAVPSPRPAVAVALSASATCAERQNLDTGPHLPTHHSGMRLATLVIASGAASEWVN